ncbi:hypothetical protein ACSMXM_12090 [Pacificimonas sp. ICDLI1SI03]
MILEAKTRGDLPDLLDTLIEAVTALDAVGVEGYRDLYLYVVGTSNDRHARNLWVENRHLIVGPPCQLKAYSPYSNFEMEASRRNALFANLHQVILAWKWSTQEAARHLHCSEAMISLWIGRSTSADIPCLPRSIAERIIRLSMVDQARCLLGITNEDVPTWLSAERAAFGWRSIHEMLVSGGDGDFRQLMMWALNKVNRAVAVH